MQTTSLPLSGNTGNGSYARATQLCSDEARQDFTGQCKSIVCDQHKEQTHVRSNSKYNCLRQIWSMHECCQLLSLGHTSPVVQADAVLQLLLKQLSRSYSGVRMSNHEWKLLRYSLFYKEITTLSCYKRFLISKVSWNSVLWFPQKYLLAQLF